jgi:hypothetical protein
MMGIRWLTAADEARHLDDRAQVLTVAARRGAAMARALLSTRVAELLSPPFRVAFATTPSGTTRSATGMSTTGPASAGKLCSPTGAAPSEAANSESRTSKASSTSLASAAIRLFFFGRAS